jgi:hypothetical protein
MISQLILILAALLMAGANTASRPAPESSTQLSGGSRQCEVILELDKCM